MSRTPLEEARFYERLMELAMADLEPMIKEVLEKDFYGDPDNPPRPFQGMKPKAE